MARKRYAKEFKDQAAGMVIRDGKTFREVAESLGIDQSSLRHWVRLARASGMKPSEATLAAQDPQSRVRDLEAQVRRLEMERDILKKSRGVLREGEPAVTFAFIRDHQDAFPVRVMCETLDISSSGYYAWCDRSPCTQAARRSELAEKIKSVHEANRGVYGSPRIHRVLLASGEKVCRNTVAKVCRNTVAKVMRTHGIRAKTHRRFKTRTTDAAHPHPIAPNTLNRNFACSRLNQVWLTDITYIPTGEGFLYLAGVMDLYSRRIIGWSMTDHLRAELVSDAFRMALATRGFKESAALPGLLHHSDRGVQYACDKYRSLLSRHGIAVSMSNTGDCYDNAPKESFWGKLKTELVHQQRFATRAQARAAVFDYIEVFYNRQRLHSSLDYTSPERFEARLS